MTTDEEDYTDYTDEEEEKRFDRKGAKKGRGKASVPHDTHDQRKFSPATPTSALFC